MALLDEYLTPEQLAAEMKVSVRTIMRWSAIPDGLPRAQVGRNTFYRRAAVLEWLASRERQPNARRRSA